MGRCPLRSTVTKGAVAASHLNGSADSAPKVGNGQELCCETHRGSAQSNYSQRLVSRGGELVLSRSSLTGLRHCAELCSFHLHTYDSIGSEILDILTAIARGWDPVSPKPERAGESFECARMRVRVTHVSACPSAGT